MRTQPKKKSSCLELCYGNQYEDILGKESISFASESENASRNL